MRGLILLAHGARDPRWADPFVNVAQQVRQASPGRLVLNAYLEFMAPDLCTAGAQLAEQGCRAVDVLPLFLGAGGHVRKDLPELMARLRADWPGVHWELHPAVGEHPELVATMARLATQLHPAAALAREDQP